ncbi:hypothetical protein [Pseudonocardia lacus]|uniref:hypothetical protein n=1 Tax=Pseudonocardia lacus TaxID=2835865 RepID=UPI001BDD2E1D|nr:hypothetical protein [Pseudonocardia lacus]
MNDPNTPIYVRAVAELAGMPKLVAALRLRHVSGEDGMCVDPVCGRPGRGTPHLPWPCPTRRLADLAMTMRSSRHRRPGQES